MSLLGAGDPAQADPKPGEPGKEVKPPENPAAAKSSEGEVKPPEIPPEPKPQGAPEKYEPFKQPEGEPLFDEDFTKKFSDIAKELNLPQEGAQKFVDFLVKEAKDAQAIIKDREKEWIGELKADKEFGGANYNENIVRAERAFTKYDKALDGALTTFIKENYLAVNPTLAKLFCHLDKAIGEDTLVEGQKPRAGEKTVEQILFPDGWDKKQANQ